MKISIIVSQISVAFIVCSVMADPDSSEESVERNLDKATQFTEHLIDGHVLDEVVAKDISVREVCELLNSKLSKHLKSVALDGFGFDGIWIDPKSSVSEKRVFFHVKKITVRAVLDLICSQNGLRYTIRKGRVTLSPAGVE